MQTQTVQAEVSTGSSFLLQSYRCIWMLVSKTQKLNLLEPLQVRLLQTQRFTCCNCRNLGACILELIDVIKALNES